MLRGKSSGVISRYRLHVDVANRDFDELYRVKTSMVLPGVAYRSGIVTGVRRNIVESSKLPKSREYYVHALCDFRVVGWSTAGRHSPFFHQSFRCALFHGIRRCLVDGYTPRWLNRDVLLLAWNTSPSGVHAKGCTVASASSFFFFFIGVTRNGTIINRVSPIGGAPSW